jgi:predicted phosphodiesterase
VKIVIISDIHANLAALEALPERDFDQLWCIGDLVDYGPKPHDVVAWVKREATIAVRGNHDHAAGLSVDPQCSPPYKKLAAETLNYTQEVCTKEDLEFLRVLPIQRETVVDTTRFYLVHACPTDPLFGYCPEESDRWRKEVDWIKADVLLVGHTHTPFIRAVGKTIIVNPGSLGQPKTGRPLACYAIWEDGRIALKEYSYPIEETIRQIRKMPISREDQDALIVVLETGFLPSVHSTKVESAGI